jgi:hypothetical protein
VLVSAVLSAAHASFASHRASAAVLKRLHCCTATAARLGGTGTGARSYTTISQPMAPKRCPELPCSRPITLPPAPALLQVEAAVRHALHEAARRSEGSRHRGATGAAAALASGGEGSVHSTGSGGDSVRDGMSFRQVPVCGCGCGATPATPVCSHIVCLSVDRCLLPASLPG